MVYEYAFFSDIILAVNVEHPVQSVHSRHNRVRWNVTLPGGSVFLEAGEIIPCVMLVFGFHRVHLACLNAVVGFSKFILTQSLPYITGVITARIWPRNKLNKDSLSRKTRMPMMQQDLGYFNVNSYIFISNYIFKERNLFNSLF